MMWESLVILLRNNPLRIFSVLFWWMRGRAFLKMQLGRRVQVHAASLPYHDDLLRFLREEKKSGRPLILATASDRKMVQGVFDHVGLFDELMASDGKTNLRGPAKLKALTERFGERGFDYAGNSSVDLPVWAGSREAIVVNASRELADRAAQQTKLGPTFIEGYSRLYQFKRILYGLFIESRYLLAMIGGLLLSLSFPNASIAGLAWIAPAFIIAASIGKAGADTFRIGYIAGLTHWLASLYWLLLIPVTGYPILGWIALCGFIALFPAAWVWIVSARLPFISAGLKPGVNGDRVASKWIGRTTWALSGAAAWVAFEMVQARIFGGFPWIPLGVSQYQIVPLIQIASVAGVYGVSFLVVWMSLSLFSAGVAILRRPTDRYAWTGDIVLPTVVVLGLFVFGMGRLRSADETGPPLRVTFIQPSIPQTMIWDASENENRFRQLMELSRDGLTNETDLLLWPEAALPRFDEASYVAITNLIRTHGTWMIFGADDVEERLDRSGGDRYDVFNAAFLFGPDGNYSARYRKQKLVMFGEYIPLARWLPFVKWLTPISGGFSAGDGPVAFEMERRPPEGHGSETDVPRGGSETGAPIRVKTSVLICFEDVFPYVVRDYVDEDTDFLVNLTNDGWFGNSAEQWQHAATAVFRSVENNVSLLRSCNNGLTCWIDSRGRLREILRDDDGSIYGPAVATWSIPTLGEGSIRERTFYNRHGDWFGWTSVVVAFGACVRRIFRKQHGDA